MVQRKSGYNFPMSAVRGWKVGSLTRRSGCSHAIATPLRRTHAGHGIGSALSIRVGQWADQYAFLFDQLSLTVPVRSDASTTGITAH